MSYRNSYADGIPLYLNKKFYPIPRSKYKEVECHIPLDALQEGYDFTVERQALVECEQYAKEKKEKESLNEELRQRIELKAKAGAEAAAEKAAALVREYEEELAKQTKVNREILAKHVVQEVIEVPDDYRTGSSYSDVNSAPAEPASPPEPNYSHVISPTEQLKTTASSSYPHIHSESYKATESASYPQMIQPELVKPLNSSKSPTRIPAAPINLSDFESDTANPFDNVELKSINDMAVLATVLQNNVTCSVPRNFNQNGEPQRVTTSSNTNVNVNTLNGVVHQPVPYYSPYLSQNNSFNPHQWTPTSQNPFYSHYTPTMVTASTTVGTSASSDSIPVQQPVMSSMPIPRPPNQQNNSTPYPSSVISPNNQIQSSAHPSSENFANFYFPFMSSQAHSRPKNPDREYS